MADHTADRSTVDLPSVPADQRGLAVAGWSEPVVIDTYLPEPPSRFPAFLDGRVYQGSSGRVYPLPQYERISPDKRPHTWQALHLENEWVRLVILPELGGRIYVGYDKLADYDFFYRNNVIKPALVGLAGPWVSGGVEFNWPQHHRPATFLPTDWEIEREDDGSITVWCSDHDPMTRMKGMHGIRLSPDSTVIEARVRLYNRTDLPQTFLWWANVAAAANEHYQSFFPPDVHQVADHAKRAVTSFPHAGRYYGVDYPGRVTAERPDGDRIDWYRNIPVPTSYMVTSTRYAFFGGYDHDRGAGFVHWADPGLSPGKKQWTWGNAPFGWAWDANLTDTDGPYVELMAGVYTDNQPDFAFIAPGETKSFSQFWYPIRGIGPAHCATLDAAVRWDLIPSLGGPSALRIGIAATRVLPDATVEVLSDNGSVVAQWTVTLGPSAPLIVEQALDGSAATSSLTLRILVGDHEVMRWRPGSDPDPDPLTAAVEPPAPSVIATTEQLVLTGLHLAQYRHATRRPEPYWQEALRRDPGDVRANTALGASFDDTGRLPEAEQCFRRALARLTALAPTPLTGEVHYRLGRCLIEQGRDPDAVALLERAAWDAAWFLPSHWALARIAARAGDLGQAERQVRALLGRDPAHLGGGCLLATILRATGRDTEAQELLDRQLALDPLHQWTRDLAGLPLTDDAPTLLDVALDHAECGAVDDALRVLQRAAEAAKRTLPGQVQVGPLVHYHRAALLQTSDPSAAEQARSAARRAEARSCLASRRQDIDALLAACRQGPDPLAELLLGSWWYERGRPEDAIAAWIQATLLADPKHDHDIPVIAHRNLGIAAMNVSGDPVEAARRYAAARRLAPDDARLFTEEDQLMEFSGTAAADRLRRLLARPDLTEQRDDLTVRTARLLAEVARFEEAVAVLRGRRFQPWEGGEGQVLAAWELAMLGRAEQALVAGQPAVAGAFVDEAIDTPAHLGEARHPLTNAAELYWWRGRCLDAAGDAAGSRVAWERAAAFEGHFADPAASGHSVQTVYSVLALRALGRWDEADAMLADLGEFTEDLARTPAAIDYFATSLPSMLLFHEDPQHLRDREVAALRDTVTALASDRRSLDDPARRPKGREAPQLPGRTGGSTPDKNPDAI